MNTNKVQSLIWEKDISIITNPLIFKQLALVSIGAGLFMAVLLTVILAVSGDYTGIPPMLLVSLITSFGLFLLLLLVSLLYFRNRIRVKFTVNHKGALWETIDKRAVTGIRLSVLSGILGGSLQAAGAGILAAAREKEFISWNEANSIAYDSSNHMIIIRNNWRPIMMLVCLPENYKQVAELIRSVHPDNNREHQDIEPIKKGRSSETALD